jgi:hypothetical protein
LIINRICSSVVEQLSYVEALALPAYGYTREQLVDGSNPPWSKANISFCLHAQDIAYCMQSQHA